MKHIKGLYPAKIGHDNKANPLITPKRTEMRGGRKSIPPRVAIPNFLPNVTNFQVLSDLTDFADTIIFYF